MSLLSGQAIALISLTLLLGASLACGSKDPQKQSLLAGLKDSIVSVEVSDGLGATGFVVPNQFVITNAHVIWPESSATVKFISGLVEHNVPVLRVDLLSDIAVLGPIPSAGNPVVFATSTPSIGDDVIAVWFRSRSGPLVTADGKVLRSRRWEEIGVTYDEIDAPIPRGGGFSGGVLVNELGSVVGVGGWGFEVWDGEGFLDINLIADIEDIHKRVERSLAAELDTLSEREQIQSSNSGADFSIQFRRPREMAMFELVGVPGDKVELTIESADLFAVSVIDPYGNPIVDDEKVLAGKKEASVEIGSLGTMYLIVRKIQDKEVQVSITSSVPIGQLLDRDDYNVIGLGEVVYGALDIARDVDVYEVELQRGSVVEVVVRNVNTAPGIRVYAPSAKGRPLDSGDTTTRKSVTATQRLSVEALETGTYTIEIYETRPRKFTGYTLVVTEP